MSDQSAVVGAGGAEQTETWGIYVYFAADIPNSLMQDAVWETLNTLASVGSSEKVKITAMIDLPDRDTEYYIFPTRPKNAAKWTVLPDRFLSNVDSASIDTILDFLDWSQRNCPAQNVALIFYGHGYALDDFDPRTPGAPDVKANFPGTTSQMGRSADGFPGESGDELKLLYDATHNSVLNNFEFAKAIRDYKEKYHTKKRVEVLGLDCCNMAMVEVLSELQDTVEYAVAPETAMPLQSWLTKQGLEKFVCASSHSARDFAVGAVQESVVEIAKSDPIHYMELAACHLTEYPRLEQAMTALVEALLPAIEKHENRRAIVEAWECDVSYLADGLIDLASFCELLQKAINAVGCAEPAVIKAANDVIEAVKGTPLPLPGIGNENGVVDFSKFAPNRDDENIALSTGLTIWFPPWIQFPHVYYYQMQQSKDYLFDGYSSTRFAKATGWDRFLRKLYRLTQT